MISPFDYAVIAFYFLFMLSIGWFFRRFIANISDYFRGGGQMVWWMAGSSAFMVAFSAWTFTGGASKAYDDGIIILAIFFANGLGFVFNYLFFAPRFRQMRVITSIEGVRLRFGKANEQFFAWLQIPLGILYAGIWLNGLAVFVAAVFGLDLTTTILVVGAVVVFVSLLSGSWGVVASDFMQMLVLMPLTIVAAIYAIGHVGGIGPFVQGVPENHFFDTSHLNFSHLVYLWIFAILLKQFCSTNNMLDASRYLNVKDSRHARRAALLGATLFFIGPIFWFIPPMAATITHPDLSIAFPQLNNPSEASFVAICLLTMPAGMIGLLISGIFAATMSSMDSGLNRNAGIFVRNFYQPVLRPHAKDRELLTAGKLTTAVFGLLVVVAALTFSQWRNIGLFDLMIKFGTLVALPYIIPLIWGVVIKRAPSWAGWSTVLVGFCSSLAAAFVFSPSWLGGLLGAELLPREASDWNIIVGVLLNITVGSTWFLGACLFAGRESPETKARVEAFFRQMRTPVDFAREMGAGNDAQQSLVIGRLCLAYGGFILLLMLIPNPLAGRLGFLFCGGVIAGIGWLLVRSAKKPGAEAGHPSSTGDLVRGIEEPEEPAAKRS